MSENPKEEFLWHSADGRQLKLNDFNDTHLMNVYWLMTKRLKKYIEKSSIGAVTHYRCQITLVKNEMDNRNLKELPYQVPFFDGNEWKILGDAFFESVGGEKKLCTDVCKRCRRCGDYEWTWYDDNLFKDGIVMCYLKTNSCPPIDEYTIPEECPYKMEHQVMGQKEMK